MTKLPLGPVVKSPVAVYRPRLASAPASKVPSLKAASILFPETVVVACANHHVLPPGALAVPACCQYTLQRPERTFGFSGVGGAWRFLIVSVTSMFALPALEPKEAFTMSRLSMFCPEPPG